jgi:hypothetical protein
VSASDRNYLNKDQLRAFAVLMRKCANGEDLAKAVVDAKRMVAHQLFGETIWRQIAEEISLMETSKS